jgi:hypothetical protein
MPLPYPIMRMALFALGIETEILLEAGKPLKDCSGKPDPSGNAQIELKVEN